jgi:hypothetical protein
MIGYVSVGTNDLGASGKFYDALLSLMGGEREAELSYYILWRFPWRRSTVDAHHPL